MLEKVAKKLFKGNLITTNPIPRSDLGETFDPTDLTSLLAKLAKVTGSFHLKGDYVTVDDHGRICSYWKVVDGKYESHSYRNPCDAVMEAICHEA